MLQKIDLVNFEKAISSTYDSICKVVSTEKIKQNNGATKFIDVINHENIPCRLSYKSSNAGVGGEVFTNVSQVVKLFLSTGVYIAPNSKVIVKTKEMESQFAYSGQAKIYPTHQEIELRLLSDKA